MSFKHKQKSIMILLSAPFIFFLILLSCDAVDCITSKFVHSCNSTFLVLSKCIQLSLDIVHVCIPIYITVHACSEYHNCECQIDFFNKLFTVSLHNIC